MNLALLSYVILLRCLSFNESCVFLKHTTKNIQMDSPKTVSGAENPFGANNCSSAEVEAVVCLNADLSK